MRNLRKAVMMAHTRDAQREDQRYDMPESRFRDRDGREHYNNGRYAPMNRGSEGEFWGGGTYRTNPQNRYLDDYPMVGDMMWPTRAMPNIQRDYSVDSRRYYDPPYMGGDGFRDRGEPNYFPQMIGYSGGNSDGVLSMYDSPRYQQNKHFTKEDAERWTKGMKNSDGTSGAHWTMDQTTQVMQQRGINCKPEEFYAVMNMLYSDFGKIAKKYGVDAPEFWAEMTKAFIDDPDAKGDKVSSYYNMIASK